jgi:hypothetical protein
MLLLKLVIISLVNVLIIDLSGFIDSLKSFISRRLTNSKFNSNQFRIKPLDCSFCMTFWTGLLYTLVLGEFTLINLCFILLMAFMTPVFKQLLLLIRDVLLKIIDKLYEAFKI